MYVCMYVCMYVSNYLPVYVFVYLPIYLPIGQPTCLFYVSESAMESGLPRTMTSMSYDVT